MIRFPPGRALQIVFAKASLNDFLSQPVRPLQDFVGKNLPLKNDLEIRRLGRIVIDPSAVGHPAECGSELRAQSGRADEAVFITGDAAACGKLLIAEKCAPCNDIERLALRQAVR